MLLGQTVTQLAMREKNGSAEKMLCPVSAAVQQVDSTAIFPDLFIRYST
jgi:hypothetical protein